MLKATTTEIVIHSDSDKTMLEDTTTINLVDEGGGHFITITQYDHNHEAIVIGLDPKEIPLLFRAIKVMLGQEKAYVV